MSADFDLKRSYELFRSIWERWVHLNRTLKAEFVPYVLKVNPLAPMLLELHPCMSYEPLPQYREWTGKLYLDLTPEAWEENPISDSARKEFVYVVRHDSPLVRSTLPMWKFEEPTMHRCNYEKVEPAQTKSL